MRFRGFTIIAKFKDSVIKFNKSIVINISPLTNLIEVSQRTIIVARYGGIVEIGENVGISGSTIYAIKRLAIGDNTLIGGNCKISDNDFHPLDPEQRRLDLRDKIAKKEIKIGKDCFIGTNAIILKGCSIGDSSIVGAGSVVSGCFPANSIIAGYPARLIKSQDV